MFLLGTIARYLEAWFAIVKGYCISFFTLIAAPREDFGGTTGPWQCNSENCRYWYNFKIIPFTFLTHECSFSVA